MQSPDTYLPPKDAAQLLGLTESSLAKFRVYGGGPPFLRLSPRRIVYQVRDLREWAAGRKFRSTSEYPRGCAA
ncbi:UNVERIFIED_ORG: hypothetical protein ABID33_000524 [Xanthobacter viscosus]|uniref:DNA-binding protein n=1 Tax=Xanthobacter autotrophicus TaxID=280 RepID=A0A6C1KHE4_XANAU|nr:DNA-binding protein [Xanthobacter autotrophicus]